MTLKERLARAIYEQAMLKLGFDAGKIVDFGNDEHKRHYLDYAQAALEAIVEGADIEAGRLAYNAAINGQGGISCDQVRVIIKAAIAER